MKKLCLILCLCIISWGLTSCGTNTEEISMEKFNNYASTYNEGIKSIDESLFINESTLAAQDGTYIKVYSIETQDRVSFGVTLTVISEKKAELLIEFSDAGENWSADNIALFAKFISKLSKSELQFDEVNTACNDIYQANEYRFNKNIRLFWDDYRSTLYYFERFAIDINS